jgi:hypothetical protein
MSRIRFRPLYVAITLLLCEVSIAQSQPSYITNLSDTRFKDVQEDWTSPSLAKSQLMPVRRLIGSVDEHADYTVELIQVQWRPADPIDLYVMRPKGITKPAVIVYLYGYPSETDIFKNPKFQEFTTKRGFAAVGFMTALTGHRYHDIPWKKWFVSELQQCLAESAHDVQMVLDYLASRKDLDMDRVGLYGQLSGATVGILASAVDPRIKVVDTLDPWGDWPTWLAKSPFVPPNERADYLKPEFLAKVASLEPIDWMSKIHARKFRLQERSFDDETPLAAKERLKAAAPASATVAFYKTADEFSYAVGPNTAKSLDWIKAQLMAMPQRESNKRADKESN